MKKDREVEMRLEDLGKQLLESAEPIEMDVVESEIQKYVEKHRKSKAFLLYGKEIGYHQVFISTENGHGTKVTSDDFARHIREYLDESSFFDSKGDQVDMKNISFVQDEEGVEGLSIWFATTYFQVIPFDFGIEYVHSMF